jgi:hypothetical protein
MKKLGKFEIKGKRQEYQTAIGILHVMREHLDKGDMQAMRHFINTWDSLYTEWLADLDRDEERL